MKKLLLGILATGLIGNVFSQSCITNVSQNPVCAGQSATMSVQAPTFNCGSALPASLQTSLVAYYPFCGNANDVSGNANNGIVNGASLTTDRFGNSNSAYSFNGTSDYIDVPHSSSLTFSNNIISVSFWIKIVSVPCCSYAGLILSKQSGSGGTQQGFNVSDNNTSGNSVGMLVSNGGGNFGGNGTGVVSLNQFHHFVLTYNGSTATCFMDGVLKSTTTGQTAIMGSNTVNLLIGKANWSNINALNFNGIIDEVLIYNKVLSSTDALQLYNLGNTTYSWSNGATTNTVVVNPSTTTNYTATASNGYNSCNSVITLTVNACASQICFSPATNYTAGATPSSVCSADFNGDGKKDLAVENGNSNQVSVLLGTGTGSFGSASSFSVGNGPACVVSADFNGDGNFDLATANENSNNVSVLLGTGTGSFGSATNFPTGSFSNNLTIADFNGDGKQDLAVTNNGSGNVSILLGTGTGSFSSATNFTVSATPGTVVSADFNGDGKLDLAVSSGISNDVSILLGTGTGSFGSATSYTVGSAPYSVTSGDFNGDGKIDLATGNSGSTNISILLGTGTGSFSSPSNYVTTSSPDMIINADFNGDANLDLATISSASNNLSVFLGTGTGSFGTASTFSVGTYPYTVVNADFNGDGKTDLATANINSSNVSVLLNTSAIVSIGGLSTICSGNSTTLTASGATSYTWSANAGSVNTTTVSVSPTSNTTYTVIGNNGSCTATETITVNVNALPAVTINASSAVICSGSAVTFTASGASTFTWSANAGSVNTATVSVSPTSNTTYTVTGNNGTCTATETIAINVSALPTVSYTQNPNSLCINNSSITLSSATPTGGTYSGTAVIGNTFDPATAGTGTFVITYFYSDINNCTNTATQNIVVNGCTDINSSYANDLIKLYPNPATEIIYVQYVNKPVSVDIFNLTGELVKSIQNLTNQIDVSDLQRGFYFMKIISTNNQLEKTLKFIKE